MLDEILRRVVEQAVSSFTKGAGAKHSLVLIFEVHVISVNASPVRLALENLVEGAGELETKDWRSKFGVKPIRSGMET